MTRPSRIPTVAAIGLALALAACQTGGAGSPSAVASAGTDDVLVAVASSADLGEFVVDAEERTLYVFLNDSPGTSVCDGDCATNWPPAALDDGATLAASDGVSAELGTLERDDGTMQLTLEGWPLYRFAGDAAPGDATGEGVGGVWFVARPDGSVPSASSEPSATPSSDASADDSGGYDPYDY